MPLTFDSGQTPKRRNEEALKIIIMLHEHFQFLPRDINRLPDNVKEKDWNFLCQLFNMYNRYNGEKVFVTSKQLFWLRDLKERYL